MQEDSYSLYESDVNRRILHSETRIKAWVIGGVLANLLVLIGIGAPMVYYLGQLSAQTTASSISLNKISSDIQTNKARVRNLEQRQNAIARFLEKQGFETPPPVED